MRFIKLVTVAVLLLWGAVKLASGAEIKEQPNLPVPVLRAVAPESAKPGDVVTTCGDNLDQSRVSEVYISNGQGDLKVEITEQTATAIKFKVPAKAAPGKYSLTVLLAGEEPKLLDEPVHLTVE